MTPAQSGNFGFLTTYDPQLVRLGGLAERYFSEDPNTCLIKLRQFAERLAQQLAARIGLFTSPEEPFAELLKRLKAERAMPREAGDLFHQLRVAGNDAAHAHRDDHETALTRLKMARQLASGFTPRLVVIPSSNRSRLFRRRSRLMHPQNCERRLNG
jgi:type I restriction enzyme R subunit